jgi:hypothetical protein
VGFDVSTKVADADDLPYTERQWAIQKESLCFQHVVLDGLGIDGFPVRVRIERLLAHWDFFFFDCRRQRFIGIDDAQQALTQSFSSSFRFGRRGGG